MRKSNLTLRTESTVFEQGRHREVILEFSPGNPDLLTFRLAGLRRRYPVEAAKVACWVQERAIEAKRRAKREARKAGK